MEIQEVIGALKDQAVLKKKLSQPKSSYRKAITTLKVNEMS